MRFHVVGLPHAAIDKDKYCSCAYTVKVYRFAQMMKSLGHVVYCYGSAGGTVPCDEYVPVISEEMHEFWWGKNDITKEHYAFEYDVTKPYWKMLNTNAIAEIGKRIQPRDFICLIAGLCQKPIADAFPDHAAVEYGIGYEGVFSRYQVFESYAHMHYVYGKYGTNDGNYYHEVIPNYYDLNDFKFNKDKNLSNPYLLFVARLVERKGLHAAALASKLSGIPLKVAGQGISEHRPGYIRAGSLVVEAPGLEYVGTLNVKQRAHTMGNAHALIMPTQYIGPFEGVTAEAMLCGTPVITTDWGCFAENVADGTDGFRTRTLGEMAWAIKECDKLDRETIVQRAEARWDMNIVRHRFHDYFERVGGLFIPGKDWFNPFYDPTHKRDLGNFR